MNRKYEVWALYNPPALMGRCWTRRGAYRKMNRYWYEKRWWLGYEIRKDGNIVDEQPYLERQR